MRRFAEPSHHQSEIQISSFFASIVTRQPINQFCHDVLRQVVKELNHRIDPLFASRNPATTTPRPPCATDGGSSTKYELKDRVAEFLFGSQQVKRISARSGA
jgi:hypothetical protein